VIASCDDVTGSVGKDVNLTCSVSLKKTECCVVSYKFQDYKIDNYSCDQRNFTWRYTPTTALKEQFRFFVQATCGHDGKNFIVDITKSSLAKREDPKSKHNVTAVFVGCFILILIIIIIMTVIYKKKPNFTKPCGFQKRMFQCIRHKEDNTTPPQDVI
ncbi:hypothetical protein M9458_051529, partial [Cirrhinus mrigala]